MYSMYIYYTIYNGPIYTVCMYVPVILEFTILLAVLLVNMELEPLACCSTLHSTLAMSARGARTGLPCLQYVFELPDVLVVDIQNHADFGVSLALQMAITPLMFRIGFI